VRHRNRSYSRYQRPGRFIRKQRELEDQVSAVLTDIILPNANEGGTPYEKAIQAIEDVIAVGSAWAMPFYNRRGDLFHADYKLLYVKDILFEKGKVSEFSSNYMGVIEWLTKSDVKAEIWKCKYLKEQAEARGEKYEGKSDAKLGRSYSIKARWTRTRHTRPVRKRTRMITAASSRLYALCKLARVPAFTGTLRLSARY